MSLRDSGYVLDFGGPSGRTWLEEFRRDPNEALFALRCWKKTAIELLYEAMDYNAGSMVGPPWHVSPLVVHTGSRPMFSLPLEFKNLTDIIALWCDSELNIDPTAITEVRRRFDGFAPRNAAGPGRAITQERVSMADAEMEEMMHIAMDVFDRVFRATEQRAAMLATTIEPTNANAKKSKRGRPNDFERQDELMRLVDVEHMKQTEAGELLRYNSDAAISIALKAARARRAT